jgi:hypothetical protein
MLRMSRLSTTAGPRDHGAAETFPAAEILGNTVLLPSQSLKVHPDLPDAPAVPRQLTLPETR